MPYKINDILEVLSESSSDYLFDVYDSIVFTEGEKLDKAKETYNKAKDKVKETTDKFKATKVGQATMKAVDKGGDVYNKVAEAPGALVAKAALKKPDKDAPPEVQKNYQAKVVKYKAVSKTIVTLSSQAALYTVIGPIDWLVTACTVAGLAKDTEVNTETRKYIASLKDKAKALLEKAKNVVRKHKDKPATDSAFRSEYDAILSEGNGIARDADNKIRLIKKPQVATVAESVITDKFDRYLINDDGVLVENAFDILTKIVEKNDYSKVDIYPVLEHYFEMAV